jgi:hypothetical protein
LSDSRENYLELIHAEMDGEATEKELTTLHGYIARDTEARELRAGLARLNNLLKQVEPVDPPGDLHNNILAALPIRRPGLKTVTQGSSWRIRIRALRYGYALAAGVLVGAALTGVALKNLSPLEKSDVYGTLAVRKNAPGYAAVDHMDLNSPGLAGSVVLSRSASNAMIVFDLQGPQTVEVEIGFDQTHMGLMSFNQQPGAVRSFGTTGGAVSFRSEGKQRSTIILSSQGTAQLTLDLRFYVGGKLIYRGTVGEAVQVGSPK